MYDIPCKWNLKRNDTNKPKKEKETHRFREQIYGCRREGEGMVRDLGMDMCTLLYLKRIFNKGLLYTIWNSAQCYSATWMRGSLRENEYMYIRMAESLHCSPETITILLMRYTAVENKKFKLKKKTNQAKIMILSKSLDTYTLLVSVQNILLH